MHSLKTYCLCVHDVHCVVCGGEGEVSWHVWKSEDNFVESFLSLCVFQVIRLALFGSKHRVISLTQHMYFNMLISQTVQSFVALANLVRQEEEIMSFNHPRNRGNTDS